jgi:spore germination cell wall hydrolase CwlJ-like protein
MRASSVLSIMGMGVLAGALLVEGVNSIYHRPVLEHRISYLEQVQDQLVEKQNYLFELLSDLNRTPVAGMSAIRVEQTGRTVNYEDLDLFCLAKNIFHEAGVETELGMFAVAQVTINRVRNARYPNSICDVVMQPAQFSWANDRDRRWTHPSGPKWEQSKQIARRVIKEGYRVPALQSAMFYHADYVDPVWRNPDAVIAQVGTHIFYTHAR